MLEKPEYQCKTGTVHSSENRIDRNQLISYAKICYYHMRAFACICMQMPLIKAHVGEARISMQNWNSTL